MDMPIFMESFFMSTQSDRLRLIEYLYRVSVEPGRYDELMACWERVLHASIDYEESSFSDAELERHVHQAMEILERLESSGTPPPLTRSIMLDPNPAMLVSEDGRIVASNESAISQLGVEVGIRIDEFADKSSNTESLLATLSEQRKKAIGTGKCFIGLLKVHGLTEPPPSMLLALSAVRCNEMPEAAGLLSTMAPVWTPMLAHALSRHFGLTVVETDLIKGLVQGLSVNEIAQTRCRSVHTVRTQIKNILRKTELESQMDLVRLAGFMGHHEDGAASRARRGSCTHDFGEGQREVIRLKNSLQMEYTIVGPEDGCPVLFIHGMLDYLPLTSQARDLLYQHHVRLIAPVRPSFGGSSPDPGGDTDAPLRFAGYAEELLDHLGVGPFFVLGHKAGSPFAYACAGHMSSRVKGVLVVAGGVPIVSPNQIAIMAPRQRLIALTTRYAPHLLPLFLKAGIALIRSGGANAFLNALYRGAPVDHAVASVPEHRELLNEGYRFATIQGYSAFQIDAQLVVTDWSYLVEPVRCPVTIVHGVHDPVVHIDTVRAFAKRHKNCKLVESEKSGQLILLSEPEVVMRELSELTQKNAVVC